jgi:hypothetical protein
MSQTPIAVVSSWELYAYGALGAVVLWIKMNAQNKKIHGLGDLFEKAAPNRPGFTYFAQFAVFVVLGSIIGKIAVDPFTQMQAFAGGVAWSRLAAKD